MNTKQEPTIWTRKKMPASYHALPLAVVAVEVSLLIYLPKGEN